jgi:hypothetical protein
VTTTYVVPCGISVLDRLGRKLAGGSAAGAFVKIVENGAWLGGISLDQHQPVLSAWRGKGAARADAAGLTAVIPRRLSAETHCLAGRQASVIPPVTDCRVLLLASDTRMGLSAAFCVGHYLTSGVPADLSYTSADDTSFKPGTAAASVTIVRVSGLQPDLTQFSQAVTGIGTVLRTAWEADGPTEVHLSGGFKATLLQTLTMTEVLHSLAPGQVSAWYAFEDIVGEDPDQPVPPMRIGLRTFPREYLEDMRQELSQVERGARNLGSATFKGMGWDDGQPPRLNTFGRGYLAVLGRPSSSPSDDNS